MFNLRIAKALIDTGKVEREIAQGWLDFETKMARRFIDPMQHFIDSEIKEAKKMKIALEKARLNMDSSINKYKKAKGSLDYSADTEYKIKKEENKIKGCQSSVWLNCYEKDGRIFFEADSDSTFVKGEIALLVRVLSNQPPEEIVKADLKFLDNIGLRQHIAVTRANGLANMIKQMKAYALAFSVKQ